MGFKKTISLAVAALLDSSVLVKADQPVHCKYFKERNLINSFHIGLRGQVYGVWNFHVNS